VAEALNLRDYEAVNWQGLLFPAATPRAMANRVAGDVAKILAQSDTRSRLETLGYEPSGITPAEMGQLMVVEQKRWTQVIRAANITSD
jgi:tripartite-type tricarboxylate transporter receptor subunit TctC